MSKEDSHGDSQALVVTQAMPRPETLRACSSSQIEYRSRFRDAAMTSTDLQQQLLARTEHLANCPLVSRKRQPPQTRNHHLESPAAKQAPSDFRWYARVRSNSNPDKSNLLIQPISRTPGITPRTCLKHANNTAKIKASEWHDTLDSQSENKSLRRVKTVDFDSSPLLALPTRVASTKVLQHGTESASRPTAHATRPRNRVHRTLSYPGSMAKAKSGLADPAITRTDVHVVAIAPSGKVPATDDMVADPATPTMQIVESNNSRYEIIWDNVPAESSIRARRRSSSASQSLWAIASIEMRGLQHVNSKLTDWSGTWDSPSESFKPTIVVFPDDDGRTPYSPDAIEDDDPVVAPPNSQRTSCTPSRMPSRQCSPIEARRDWQVPMEDTLLLPEADVQRNRSSPRTKQSLASRKLSNVEASDMKFRGHRDSLTLAHSRLVHSVSISPELFTHRDSVSMAKKRMHARNHAISAARDIPTKSASPLLDCDGDEDSLDLSAIKEHAVQALKSKASAPILGASKGDARRHIQIVE